MSKIQILDCTLRDGGYINEWDFGYKAIKNIIKQLVMSNVDIVELGFLRNEVYNPDKTVFSCVKEAYNLLPENCGNSEFTLMALHNNYDITQLEPYDGGKINKVRVTFHDYDIDQGLEFCKKVLEKGYQVACNPINIMGYSDREILTILEKVNAMKPTQFSIVDTFGSMKSNDLIRLYSLCENNLDKDIEIGLHLHENLSLSYALAQEFLKMKHHNRKCIIDGSLLGMGRVPGNLCIELIMDYLNNNYNKTYNLDPVLDAIDDHILAIKRSDPWGYSTEYSISAKYNLHRNYAEFLLDKGKLKAKDVNHILAAIDNSKKTAYDESYVEKLYYDYQDCATDDTKIKIEFAEILKDREILILAPGGSLKKYTDEIKKFIEEKHPIVITTNFKTKSYLADYMFFSNIKRYEEYVTNEDIAKVLITSNIKEHASDICGVFNYHDLVFDENGIFDNCTIMLLRLLAKVNVKQVNIAGFDGYKEDNTNYVEGIINYQDANYDAANINILICTLLLPIKQQISIEFITPSKYEEVH